MCLPAMVMVKGALDVTEDARVDEIQQGFETQDFHECKVETTNKRAGVGRYNTPCRDREYTRKQVADDKVGSCS